MHDRNDEDPLGLKAIDHTEGEVSKQVTPRAVVEGRPRFWVRDDGSLGGIEFLAELARRRDAALGVPPGRRFSLAQRGG